MSIKLKISYIFFFLVIGNLLVNGQSTASTKEDEAYRLHENKEYTKAAEIYEELLKQTTKILTCLVCAAHPILHRKI